MGMHIDTVVNRMRDLRLRIDDLVSKARSFSMSHNDILKEWNEICVRYRYDKLPGYARSVLFERFSVRLQDLYQMAARDNEVVWQLYLDGERVGRPGQTAVPSGRWGDTSGQHEWSKTGKLFFKGEEK